MGKQIPVVILLGIYPTEMKTDVYMKICARVPSSLLWNRSEVDTFQSWYIHAMEHYSAMKKEVTCQYTQQTR